MSGASGAGPSGTEVWVRSAGGAYPVMVHPGLRRRLPELLRRHAPGHRYALISDSNVAPLYGIEALEACRETGLRADLFTFPAGEAQKTRAEWSSLTDCLLEAGVGRDGVVVAVGGGVTGDLAGFVAATYLRGIPVVQVPTSVVAMVDASVGGKTGLDVPAGKNLVGAFHPPKLVLIDPETVGTLLRQERAEGLAEALKHGAIVDRGYFTELEARSQALLSGDAGATYAAVVRSVEIKTDIVSADEREGGLRQILNFGHTLGHALEAAASYRIGHGTAVSAGMVLEARLGERIGITEGGTARRIEASLAGFGLGRSTLAQSEVETALRYLSADKKSREGGTRFVLLARLGEVSEGEGWSHRVPLKVVEEVLRGAADAK